MANIERRPRKDGSTAHLLRWVDKKTGKRKTQRFDEAKDAEFMLTVLEAHDLDTSAALSGAQKHFAAAYTVTKMVEDHIDFADQCKRLHDQAVQGSAGQAFSSDHRAH